MSDNSINTQANVQHEKVKIFCCNTCDVFYLSGKSLRKHQIDCKKDFKITDLQNKTKALEVEINDLKTTMTNKDNLVNNVMEIAKSNAKSTETTVNILKYAKINLNNAEPFEELKGNDIYEVMNYKNPKNIESINETYVETAIHKFNHGIFHAFIGDMIIEHYKPKTKNDVNLITTDASRLCFIIMQQITKKGNKTQKKEWINDKSGKKFTELVLKPLFNAIGETLMNFNTFKQAGKLNETILNLMTKSLEIKRDMDVNKFTNKILKYVAPNFHFDKLKLLDEKEELDYMDSDSESDEVPIKIIAKKRK
jgi:hypothetical protein